jgi:hypothetical protein
MRKGKKTPENGAKILFWSYSTGSLSIKIKNAGGITMRYTVYIVICVLAVFLITLNVCAEDELERAAIAKCTKLALKMFGTDSFDKQKSGALDKPRHITNIEYFVTWRAACAEKPPTVPGNVTALCQGDAITPTGQQKKVFYWEKASGKTLHTGYYWCE